MCVLCIHKPIGNGWSRGQERMNGDAHATQGVLIEGWGRSVKGDHRQQSFFGHIASYSY